MVEGAEAMLEVLLRVERGRGGEVFKLDAGLRMREVEGKGIQRRRREEGGNGGGDRRRGEGEGSVPLLPA